MAGLSSGPPASSSATRRPASTRRLAITHPAEPAPTTMWSNSAFMVTSSMFSPACHPCAGTDHAGRACPLTTNTPWSGVDGERGTAGQAGHGRALYQLVEVLV